MPRKATKAAVKAEGLLDAWVPVIRTDRVYATLTLAEAARPVGYFILQERDFYVLAVGNLINEDWDWQYAREVGPHWPSQLFASTEVKLNRLLTAAPATVPPLPYHGAYSSGALGTYGDTGGSEFEGLGDYHAAEPE